MLGLDEAELCSFTHTQASPRLPTPTPCVSPSTCNPCWERRGEGVGEGGGGWQRFSGACVYLSRDALSPVDPAVAGIWGHILTPRGRDDSVTEMGAAWRHLPAVELLSVLG